MVTVTVGFHVRLVLASRLVPKQENAVSADPRLASAAAAGWPGTQALRSSPDLDVAGSDEYVTELLGTVRATPPAPVVKSLELTVAVHATGVPVLEVVVTVTLPSWVLKDRTPVGWLPRSTEAAPVCCAAICTPLPVGLGEETARPRLALAVGLALTAGDGHTAAADMIAARGSDERPRRRLRLSGTSLYRRSGLRMKCATST